MTDLEMARARVRSARTQLRILEAAGPAAFPRGVYAERWETLAVQLERAQIDLINVESAQPSQLVTA